MLFAVVVVCCLLAFVVCCCLMFVVMCCVVLFVVFGRLLVMLFVVVSWLWSVVCRLVLLSDVVGCCVSRVVYMLRAAVRCCLLCVAC